MRTEVLLDKAFSNDGFVLAYRSDVAGQVLPLLGKDWTQNGVVTTYFSDSRVVDISFNEDIKSFDVVKFCFAILLSTLTKTITLLPELTCKLTEEEEK